MMDNIRPEDRPKLVVLSVLVVVVFGFVIMQIMKAMGGGSPAPTPASSVVAGDPTTVASNAPPVPTDEDMIEVPTIFAGAGIDPFQKVLLPPEPPKTISERVTSGTGFRPRPSGDYGPIPPPIQGDFRPVNPGEPGGGGEVVVEDQVPTLSLKGLVFGPEPVAVLASGEETYVVRVGEAVPGGFRVKKIDDTGVTLSYGKAQIKVALGAS